jgi:predicted DsbA family dithiol-disulfide isomerase
MIPHPKPLQIVMYQDPLCAWCYVAERRVELLRQELGELVRIQYRSYALRPHDALPTPQEVAAQVREVRRARREPEGKLLRPDLWRSSDPPRSSLPALVALEAARLQGPDAQRALAQAMRMAGLEQGVNVTRSDVIYELASRVGLNMNRFSAAFTSPSTHGLVADDHEDAVERGVKGVPTLVMAGRWMVSGLRTLEEYREHVLGCFARKAKTSSGTSGETLVH